MIRARAHVRGKSLLKILAFNNHFSRFRTCYQQGTATPALPVALQISEETGEPQPSLPDELPLHSTQSRIIGAARGAHSQL